MEFKEGKEKVGRLYHPHTFFVLEKARRVCHGCNSKSIIV